MAQEGSSSPISSADREKANQFFLKSLQESLREGRQDLTDLHRKLGITYYVIICLSIIMFLLGIVLLSVPIASGFRGNPNGGTIWNSIVAGAFGITDLVALFLFRPIERIHSLMGDMSQITLALNSYQTQVSLRLLECDSSKPDTLGATAEQINEAALKSIQLVQEYFEAKAQAKPQPRGSRRVRSCLWRNSCKPSILTPKLRFSPERDVRPKRPYSTSPSLDAVLAFERTTNGCGASIG